MIIVLKILASLLLSSTLALAEESQPSFSFSKEKGLQALNPSEKTEQKSKNSVKQKASVTQKTTNKEETKSSSSTQKLSVEQEIQVEKNPESLASQPNNPESSALKPATPDKNTESDPINTVSEDFAPAEQEAEKIDWMNVLSEDVSWFFQEKKTRHKIAIVPSYSYNRSQGSRLGLRFFSYSSEKQGYYLSFSGSKYLSSPFYRWDVSYIGNRKGDFRTESSVIYDQHYEKYFGEGAMQSKLSDLEKIYARRFIASYKLFYQPLQQNFYVGLDSQIFYRKEKPELQEDKTYFDTEFFLFFSAFAGYDSRDNWSDPTRGVFHQLSLGCKSTLAYPGAYCRGEADLRFYISLFEQMPSLYSFKDSVLALRILIGSSFLSKSTYSTAYSLSGESTFQKTNFMRGFQQNRFRGDKIYLAQSEYRFPIWKHYLQGAVFLELGEVAEYEKSFQGFVVDYGGGLRIGLPPNYDMKLRCDFGTGKDQQGKRNYNAIISFLQAF